jgi:hypothetical protein
MYLTKPSFVYGFHGIDRDAAIRIIGSAMEFTFGKIIIKELDSML